MAGKLQKLSLIIQQSSESTTCIFHSWKFRNLFSTSRIKNVHADKQKHEAMKVQHTAPSLSKRKLCFPSCLLFIIMLHDMTNVVCKGGAFITHTKQKVSRQEETEDNFFLPHILTWYTNTWRSEELWVEKSVFTFTFVWQLSQPMIEENLPISSSSLKYSHSREQLVESIALFK